MQSVTIDTVENLRQIQKNVLPMTIDRLRIDTIREAISLIDAIERWAKTSSVIGIVLLGAGIFMMYQSSPFAVIPIGIALCCFMFACYGNIRRRALTPRRCRLQEQFTETSKRAAALSRRQESLIQRLPLGFRDAQGAQDLYHALVTGQARTLEDARVCQRAYALRRQQLEEERQELEYRKAETDTAQMEYAVRQLQFTALTCSISEAKQRARRRR